MEARTGVSVVICPEGAVGGVDVRGGSPGTRETDVLRMGAQVDRVNAVALCGGSAFGLDATAGIMAYLEWKNIGFDVGVAKVPIVSAAVLFDLTVGRSDIRPDGEMGNTACRNAHSGPVEQGRVGAGAGATVGKAFGDAYRMDAGLGSASVLLPGGAVVAAMVAVNALGDIVDYRDGKILAGARRDGKYIDTLTTMMELPMGEITMGGNTTIGVIATNVAMDKAQANRLALVAHDGYAQAIKPVHTPFDGDTVFSMATGEIQSDINAVYAAAPVAMARAIANAVLVQQR